LLTWLFVVQALLIGVLFLGINYYLWQSMARIKGGERYQPYYQLLLGVLMLALFIWLTPHTLLTSASEVKAMGGAQHPVIGNYGVMSAKNGAVNILILVTALSFLYYRRANRRRSVRIGCRALEKNLRWVKNKCRLAARRGATHRCGPTLALGGARIQMAAKVRLRVQRRE